MAAVAWPGFGESKPAADFRVLVYVDYQGGGDLRGVNLWKAIASKMLRRIGVFAGRAQNGSGPLKGI